MIQSQTALSIFVQTEHVNSSLDGSLPHINVLVPEAPDSIASLSCIFAAIFCNCRKEVCSNSYFFLNQMDNFIQLHSIAVLNKGVDPSYANK